MIDILTTFIFKIIVNLEELRGDWQLTFILIEVTKFSGFRRPCATYYAISIIQNVLAAPLDTYLTTINTYQLATSISAKSSETSSILP